MSSAPSTYRAVQVAADGSLEPTHRQLTDPTRGHVRLRVEACGVCHTDAYGFQPHPETEQGRVPGHEVVGVIDAVGEGVTRWAVGDRVGVGFLAGHCGECVSCRRGDFVTCKDQPKTGLEVDGGYAEYMIARQTGLVAIPDGMPSADVAPLLCAGLTTYNGVLNSSVRPGSVVGILGIGGLGHLGLQYADKMGMHVVALARGTDKEKLARELGADEYIDSSGTDAVAALNELGGADVIVATASSGDVASGLIAGLADHGRLMILGASPVTVGPDDLKDRGIRILGSLTGTPIQNEDNLAFARRQGVKALIEERPLDEAPAAVDRMLSGKARFRMVLVP
ncbi:alcohol dehydrogenase catalytic domain-containing protein [Streptomyces liangshanensis]|uniref:Alcohol dehydrogenase n=1 Tax=Streptomyces liangshanensis TaxID=2717324 RepID=A0A6G9GUH9_9ACTN|nr:alcohol dehydrogenase catalytic domain-containing protein [Streptomyces liangshanensis]QIQ01875.1 alcohol dehydrogenase catalytic domain-containing protein [Streptomyces liangshanensis]